MRMLMLASLLLVTPAGADEPPSFDIDPGRITVSGVSSGAHMATQLHIAWSDLFSGVAFHAFFDVF